MDIFVDPDGVVVVRNCGCGKHGLTSFWDEHDKKWRGQNRSEAIAILAKRNFGPGRSGAARVLIEKTDA